MKFGKVKQLLCAVLATCAISGSLSAATAAQLARLNANGDSGLWLEENLYIKLPLTCGDDPCADPKDWLLTLHAEQRWGSRFEVQWYFEFEQIIQKDFAAELKNYMCLCDDSWLKNLYFGPGVTEYEQISKQNFGPGLTKWVWVIRPFVQANLNVSLWDWDINQRFRYEWQEFLSPNYHDYNNFRYKIEFFAPWKWTCYKIQPWIANEFFFRRKTYNPTSNPSGLVGGFYEDRFRVGIQGQLTDTFQLKIWYQIRFLEQKVTATQSKKWWENYHLGLTLSGNF